MLWNARFTFGGGKGGKGGKGGEGIRGNTWAIKLVIARMSHVSLPSTAGRRWRVSHWLNCGVLVEYPRAVESSFEASQDSECTCYLNTPILHTL